MLTANKQLNDFISEIENLCMPINIHLCDGSKEEFNRLTVLMELSGTLIKLTREKSWLARSDPDDVARVEGSTYICSNNEIDAGPTNNWKDPNEMRVILKDLFTGCMRGRTMYVIPYCMGPIGSPIARYGIEITDSPYVVCSMRIMARIGTPALEEIEKGARFVPGVHSVGKPLLDGDKDVAWPCSTTKYIVHFPDDLEIWSFGSGYGGNALLGKKCFALRIASVMARDEGGMAEHMLILGITNPKGKKKYFAAAFPSACGKTNLAMMESALPGWKVECVGDDIAWMRFGDDGKLYAINPEAGFFGVAPGTSTRSNPHAMESMERNSLFTNVALTKEGDVWWEGMTKDVPEGLIDWKGKPWDEKDGTNAAHPNSRFTAPLEQCPVKDPSYKDPKGVPIEAFIFGGRRSDLIPLVLESKSWTQGVFMGMSQTSEKTAAASGKVGDVRHDPFAMLPFCGYNMGDYFSHWLDLEQSNRTMPKIFTVNWFRKDSSGKFLWPGFGENVRVLKWCFERIDGDAEGEETPVGILPKDIDTTGLEIDPETLRTLLTINRPGFIDSISEMEEYSKIFEDRFPERLSKEILRMKDQLK